MVDFLILCENLFSYTKKDIDLGNTPPDIYRLCSCIRDVFCISYFIRKENKLIIHIEDQNILIRFEGETLKFLGSDERSQALLFNKAIMRLNNVKDDLNYHKWIRSTPGITVKKEKSENSLQMYLNTKNYESYIIFNENISKYDLSFLTHSFDYPKIINFKRITNFEKSLVIIPFILTNKAIILDFLKNLARLFPSMLERTIITRLNRIKKIEDKIIYINYQLDKQQDCPQRD